MLCQLNLARTIAIDTEGNSLDNYDPTTKLWCVGMASDDVEDCHKWDTSVQEHLNLLLAEDYKFVFHNAAFDVPILRRHGIDIKPGQYLDTMLMAYSLYPGTPMGLDALGKEFVGRGKSKSPNFAEYSEEMRMYCIDDTTLTWELFLELKDELECWPSALECFEDLEMPYCEKIIEMEQAGVRINWQDYEVHFEEERQVLSNTYEQFFIFPEIRRGFELSDSKQKSTRITKGNMMGIQAKDKFNPNSPRHIADALERFGCTLPVSSKGNRKTSKDVLEKLPSSPFIDTLQTYRKHDMLVTTFFPALANNRMGDRVYGNFNQASVRTGRLSSSEPNLQNIPSRDERGALMRRMFIPNEGNILYAGDLDRIELVVLGFYLEVVLGYNKLSERIKSGEDVHQSNTDEWGAIAGIELLRKRCKNGIFALCYGCGYNKFANTVGIPIEAAKKIFEQSEIIQLIRQFREVLVAQAINNKGMLSNFFGRNLFIPEILSPRKDISIVGERLCLNYMIQSTAGDVFKFVQLAVQDTVDLYKLMQLIVVHDETLYEGEIRSPDTCMKVAQNLSDVYSTDELLKSGDTWARIRCKFWVGENWWLAKLAEDVIGDSELPTDELLAKYDITREEYTSIMLWNTEPVFELGNTRAQAFNPGAAANILWG